jgi:hypothetical protein
MLIARNRTGLLGVIASLANTARRSLVRNRYAACLLAAILPFVFRLSLLPLWPIPEPRVHDEFSYLLGADTFAHGRLANPPHPMWVHFETSHVNHQPTYATKYPPAQSFFLLLGRKVFGHPWYGVLLSVSVMCACVCWMLRGWLPATYAFLGSLLTIAQFGATSYWADSYWGGAVAAAGGALVLGALPRLARRESLAAVVSGLSGAAVLVNSRPYEGLVLTLSALMALLWWRHKEGRPVGRLLRRDIVASATIICGAAVLWSGYYNYRVTGNPWLLPYAVNQKTYSVYSVFWLLPPGPHITYRHELLRQIWVDWYGAEYFAVRANPARIARSFVNMVSGAYEAPLRFSILVAILLVPTRRVRIALAIAGAVAVALLMETMIGSHYFAPATAVMIFLAMTGVRYLMRRIRRQPAAGRVVTTLLFAGLMLAAFALNAREYLALTASRQQMPHERVTVVRRLLEQGPRHLVIVRYGADHWIHYDWVQNEADIDGSTIVWARDMGEAANRELLEYYPDRMAWLLEPDCGPALAPYVRP